MKKELGLAVESAGEESADGDGSEEGVAKQSIAQRQVSTKWVVVITSLLVAAVVGLFVFLLATRDSQQSFLVGRGIVGQPAPLIEGETIDGGTFNSDHHLGKWMVVNFFASWCVGCIEEYPELEEFNQRHQSGDAIVVTVVFNDTRERVLQSVMGDADWPVIYGENRDDTGRIAVDYSVTALPETYVVSPSGVVVEKLVGASGVTADSLDFVIARESAALARAAEQQADADLSS